MRACNALFGDFAKLNKFRSEYTAVSRKVLRKRRVLFFGFTYVAMNINTFRLVTQLSFSPLGLRMLPQRSSFGEDTLPQRSCCGFNF